MDKNRILEIIGDVKNKSNKDLLEVRDGLTEEFEKTKSLILDLTRHLESVEKHYETVNNEIGKRTI